jgi:hypothetical protein
MNLLNKELKDKSLSLASKKFYKYNILFGYKTNNIIKSYTPKLIMKNRNMFQEVSKNGLEPHQIFNEKEIYSLFNQKCQDLNIILRKEKKVNYQSINIQYILNF